MLDDGFTRQLIAVPCMSNADSPPHLQNKRIAAFSDFKSRSSQISEIERTIYSFYVKNKKKIVNFKRSKISSQNIMFAMDIEIGLGLGVCVSVCACAMSTRLRLRDSMNDQFPKPKTVLTEIPDACHCMEWAHIHNVHRNRAPYAPFQCGLYEVCAFQIGFSFCFCSSVSVFRPLSLRQPMFLYYFHLLQLGAVIVGCWI